MSSKDVVIVLGSIRKDSFSRKIAKAIIGLAPQNLKFEIVEISQLPLYNQDSDVESVPAYDAFRKRIAAANAVLFVTPEHNRSMPAALKNALDVASRPWGKNVWNGKPAAVVSISGGSISGFGANHHLRQSLAFLNLPTMAQPEAYLGGVDKLMNDKGELTSETTKEFLTKFLGAYTEWINRF